MLYLLQMGEDQNFENSSGMDDVTDLSRMILGKSKNSIPLFMKWGFNGI